jgi:hypothetical protein
VPHLLQGIRTSFWASVAGIGFALTIKLRLTSCSAMPPRRRALAQSGASVDDLLVELQRLNKAVSGTDEAGLLGQLQAAREDTNARLDRLTAAFETYADKVAESNSKALIKAHCRRSSGTSTPRSTNSSARISKQLNAAVGKLVAWQAGHEVASRSAHRAGNRDAQEHDRGLVALRGARQQGRRVRRSRSNRSARCWRGSRRSVEQLEASLGGFARLRRARGVRLARDRAPDRIDDRADRARRAREPTAAQPWRSNRQTPTSTAICARRARSRRSRLRCSDKALEEELRRAIESLGRQLTALVAEIRSRTTRP